MITVPAGVRIYLACGATDIRNYAGSMIMRGPRREVAARHGFLARLTWAVSIR